MHLSKITLLEFVQVHFSCGLPGPVKLTVEFAPDRFWNRFDTIRKELVKAAEERKLALLEQEEEDDEGYESDVDIAEVKQAGQSEGAESKSSQRNGLVEPR